MTLSSLLKPSTKPMTLRATGAGVNTINILPPSKTNCLSLYISYNSISSLENITQFKKLKELLMDFNEISRIEDLQPLSTLKNLTVLHIEGNPVCNLPLWDLHLLTFCPKLRVLNGQKTKDFLYSKSQIQHFLEIESKFYQFIITSKFVIKVLKLKTMDTNLTYAIAAKIVQKSMFKDPNFQNNYANKLRLQCSKVNVEGYFSFMRRKLLNQHYKISELSKTADVSSKTHSFILDQIKLYTDYDAFLESMQDLLDSSLQIIEIGSGPEIVIQPKTDQFILSRKTFSSRSERDYSQTKSYHSYFRTGHKKIVEEEEELEIEIEAQEIINDTNTNNDDTNNIINNPNEVSEIKASLISQTGSQIDVEISTRNQSNNRPPSVANSIAGIQAVETAYSESNVPTKRSKKKKSLENEILSEPPDTPETRKRAQKSKEEFDLQRKSQTQKVQDQNFNGNEPLSEASNSNDMLSSKSSNANESGNDKGNLKSKNQNDLSNEDDNLNDNVDLQNQSNISNQLNSEKDQTNQSKNDSQLNSSPENEDEKNDSQIQIKDDQKSQNSNNEKENDSQSQKSSKSSSSKKADSKTLKNEEGQNLDKEESSKQTPSQTQENTEIQILSDEEEEGLNEENSESKANNNQSSEENQIQNQAKSDKNSNENNSFSLNEEEEETENQSEIKIDNDSQRKQDDEEEEESNEKSNQQQNSENQTNNNNDNNLNESDQKESSQNSPTKNQNGNDEEEAQNEDEENQQQQQQQQNQGQIETEDLNSQAQIKNDNIDQIDIQSPTTNDNQQQEQEEQQQQQQGEQEAPQSPEAAPPFSSSASPQIRQRSHKTDGEEEEENGNEPTFNFEAEEEELSELQKLGGGGTAEEEEASNSAAYSNLDSPQKSPKVTPNRSTRVISDTDIDYAQSLSDTDTPFKPPFQPQPAATSNAKNKREGGHRNRQNDEEPFIFEKSKSKSSFKSLDDNDLMMSSSTEPKSILKNSNRSKSDNEAEMKSEDQQNPMIINPNHLQRRTSLQISRANVNEKEGKSFDHPSSCFDASSDKSSEFNDIRLQTVQINLIPKSNDLIEQTFTIWKNRFKRKLNNNHRPSEEFIRYMQLQNQLEEAKAAIKKEKKAQSRTLTKHESQRGDQLRQISLKQELKRKIEHQKEINRALQKRLDQYVSENESLQGFLESPFEKNFTNGFTMSYNQQSQSAKNKKKKKDSLTAQYCAMLREKK